MKILIDGNHLAHRCLYRFEEFTTSRGNPSGIIFGFLKSIHSYREFGDYSDMTVCWDGGRSRKRRDLYPQYKADRDSGKMEYMSDQLEDLRRALSNLGIRQAKVRIDSEGIEADDIVAILANENHSNNISTLVISGDSDFEQLVGPNIALLNTNENCVLLLDPDCFSLFKDNMPKKGKYEFWEYENWSEGIPAHKALFYKALLGDSTDNISGIPGVGPVKAELLCRLGFNSADYFNFDETKLSEFPGQPKRQRTQFRKALDLLLEHKSIFLRNLELVALPKTWDDSLYSVELREEAKKQIKEIPVRNLEDLQRILDLWELKSLKNLF